MKNWIADIKNFFEKKSSNENNKKGNSENMGFVKERTKFFEGLQSTNTSRSDYAQSTKFKSCDLLRYSPTDNNLDKTPAMVMNSDNICIYKSEDTIYGSFKKRPTFPNDGGYAEEEEVFMRLKVREEEHSGIRRYESMLKAPLTQHVIVNKYLDNNNSPLKSEALDSTDHITSMIDKWNQQCLSNKEQENLIDIALLNSIRKPKIMSKGPERPLKMLQMLEDNRSLKWSDMEKVQSRQLLDKLSREEVMFQESQFELIVSEASYYRSLNVLIDKFYNSPLLSLDNTNNDKGTKFIIKAHQKEHLFSNILQIHSISGKFLAELEKRFTVSVVMKDICDIVTKFAESHFTVYVTYIQNQKFQTEAYNELKRDEKASKVIEELESQPECCSLNLDSFLLLPMQRMLRILLLLKAIKKHVPKTYTLSINSVDSAICATDKIINQCSIKKDHMDERQRMLEISRSLTFKAGQTFIPLSSGTLLHEGEVKCSRKNVGMKNYLSSIRKTTYDSWLILTDKYLLITKISKTKDLLTYMVEEAYKVNEISVQEISPLRQSENRTFRDFTIVFNDKNTYTIQTRSKEDYSKWISELSICNGS